MLPTLCFAQGTEVSEGITINLGTFTGIVAVVSAIVTQLSKYVAVVAENKIAKIGVSALVGASVCFVAWGLHISEPLEGFIWWQVLVYGVASGLSGCGFYDLIKAIGGLFNK